MSERVTLDDSETSSVSVRPVSLGECVSELVSDRHRVKEGVP